MSWGSALHPHDRMGAWNRTTKARQDGQFVEGDGMLHAGAAAVTLVDSTIPAGGFDNSSEWMR